MQAPDIIAFPIQHGHCHNTDIIFWPALLQFKGVTQQLIDDLLRILRPLFQHVADQSPRIQLALTANATGMLYPVGESNDQDANCKRDFGDERLNITLHSDDR